mmetsp:Transcript_86805/g.153561  ORF Transcript_86805/g.153561 Transcript_86805/m.153561 type:complete len:99 (-) Transcript_86805:858-1154(-)
MLPIVTSAHLTIRWALWPFWIASTRMFAILAESTGWRTMDRFNLVLGTCDGFVCPPCAASSGASALVFQNPSVDARKKNWKLGQCTFTCIVFGIGRWL